MLAVLVVLYALGGLCELFGLAVIAGDIRDAERRAEEIPLRPINPVSGGTLQSALRDIRRRPDPVPLLVTELQVLRVHYLATIRNLEIAVVQSRRDTINTLSGNVGRRKLGLGALVLGLVLGVAGNIVSAAR